MRLVCLLVHFQTLNDGTLLDLVISIFSGNRIFRGVYL